MTQTVIEHVLSRLKSLGIEDIFNTYTAPRWRWHRTTTPKRSTTRHTGAGRTSTPTTRRLIATGSEIRFM
jgi:hypothetical protein